MIVTCIYMILGFFLAPYSATQDISVSQKDSLTVYIFLQPECVISQYFTPELNELEEEFKDQHVGFVGLFPNPGVSESDLDTFSSTFNIHFPLKLDPGALQAKAMTATITPEVVVMDEARNLKIYQGRINDSYVRVGKRKQHIQSNDLRDLLSKWVSEPGSIAFSQTKSIGCLINFTTTPGIK